MDPYDISIYRELQEVLHDIRQKSLPDLHALAVDLLPPERYPSQFIDSLDDTHKVISLKASLLVYFASKCTIVPRQYQLEANNALEDGRDILVDSGTGSGKNLFQIIPCSYLACSSDIQSSISTFQSQFATSLAFNTNPLPRSKYDSFFSTSTPAKHPGLATTAS
ncbi:hypothetical protein B0H14DRAFT_2584413 [Mycena olivaceomarginata]|nr:hypothetical protein B0H14DRAFT_2584413 [Mycena olivaceomarginata]